MDDISHGIASAALTLQTVMLQALVSKGLLTAQEALEIVDRSLDAIMDTPDDDEIDGVAEIAHACLEQVGERPSIGPADLPVIEEPDVWRAAKLLVDQHGDEAALRAAQRADKLMDEGDMDGVAVWRPIVAAIEELTRAPRKDEPIQLIRPGLRRLRRTPCCPHSPDPAANLGADPGKPPGSTAPSAAVVPGAGTRRRRRRHRRPAPRGPQRPPEAPRGGQCGGGRSSDGRTLRNIARSIRS
jgi:hypothetical protein